MCPLGNGLPGEAFPPRSTSIAPFRSRLCPSLGHGDANVSSPTCELASGVYVKEEIKRGIHLQAVLDTAVDGIIMIDSKGKILTVNAACHRLFGYPASEVVGRNVKMLMPPIYSENHDSYLSNYQRTHEPKIIGIGRAVLGQRKEDEIFPSICRSARQSRTGFRFVGIISDLTERRATENRLRRSQRMEAIGQLTAGLRMTSTICWRYPRQSGADAGACQPAADARELAMEAMGPANAEPSSCAVCWRSRANNSWNRARSISTSACPKSCSC